MIGHSFPLQFASSAPPTERFSRGRGGPSQSDLRASRPHRRRSLGSLGAQRVSVRLPFSSLMYDGDCSRRGVSRRARANDRDSRFALDLVPSLAERQYLQLSQALNQRDDTLYLVSIKASVAPHPVLCLALALLLRSQCESCRIICSCRQSRATAPRAPASRSSFPPSPSTVPTRLRSLFPSPSRNPPMCIDSSCR